MPQYFKNFLHHRTLAKAVIATGQQSKNTRTVAGNFYCHLIENSESDSSSRSHCV